MNEITKTAGHLPVLQMNEAELIEVLGSSLYPGASTNSIRMVIGYCKASGLDPMQKPVHIVPMWDSKAGQMRDVVMPGIGLYRTQASRSRQMAGISEPEFGPMIEAELGGQKVNFPEWCKVTVNRLMPGGGVSQFTAIEYWTENYAIKGGKEKSIAPNAMWSKRPRGQIAKCAEAQALRKAFPEFGSAPTADEMEGKVIEMGAAEVVQPPAPPALPAYPAEDFEKNLPEWQRKLIDTGKKTPSELLSMLSTKASFEEQQKARILSLKKVAADEPKAKTAEPAGDPWVDQYETTEGGEQ